MHKIAKEKMRDVLMSGALGDAFGYLIEFDDVPKIYYKYGPLGLRLHALQKRQEIEVSDDTQMTMFLLQAMMNSHDFLMRNIYTEFKNWYETQQQPFKPMIYQQKSLLNEEVLFKRQAPGNTCMNALSMNSPGSIQNRINNSTGCGTIMRVAPIAFLDKNIHELFELGAKQGAITHGHPLAFQSSGFFAVLLNQMLLGHSLAQSMQTSQKALQAFNEKNGVQSDLNQYLDVVQNYMHQDSVLPADKMCDVLGEGWQAHHALGIALYSVHKMNDFENLIFYSANHRGDSDSTCTLAMQLYASQHDVTYFELYFEKLDIFDLLKIQIKNYQHYLKL